MGVTPITYGTRTPTFINHYAPNGDLQVLLCYLNGVPVYGRYGTRAFEVSVTKEWIEATQPRTSDKP